jgi:hypothetical protein
MIGPTLSRKSESIKTLEDRHSVWFREMMRWENFIIVNELHEFLMIILK